MKVLQTNRIKSCNEQIDFWTRNQKESAFAPIATEMIEYATRCLEDATKQSPTEIVRDTMPRDIATDSLLSTKIFSSFRRACLNARETHYQATQQRKPVETKLARRYKAAKLNQLDKWFRRGLSQKNKVTLSLIAAMGLPEGKIKTQLKNTLTIMQSALETQLVCLQDELADRESRCIQAENKNPNRHRHPRYILGWV